MSNSGKCYILNLTLSKYITLEGFTNPFIFNEETGLTSLVKFWNHESNKNKWSSIHYPCVENEFEIVPVSKEIDNE